MKNTLNKRLKNFIKIAKALDKNKKIKLIMLYGSNVNNNANKLSDIDICVYYDDNKKNAFNFRKKLLGKLSEKYDVQIFQNLPLYVRKEILGGKVLYVRNRRFLYDVAYKTIKEFDDFKKYYYDYISRNKNVKEKINRA